MYTRLVTGLTATASGPAPVLMVDTVRVFPSITVTELLLWLTTQARLVLLTATAMGCCPAGRFIDAGCATRQVAAIPAPVFVAAH